MNMNSFVLVKGNGYPKDFGGKEIAIGYVKETSSMFTDYVYLPIYFSDDDWYIYGASKYCITKQELIAYARVGEFEGYIE